MPAPRPTIARSSSGTSVVSSSPSPWMRTWSPSRTTWTRSWTSSTLCGE
ncbi:hypothetical protein [Nocardioides panacis]|nr:hypothetical protein [Nocardioides panacis]